MENDTCTGKWPLTARKLATGGKSVDKLYFTRWHSWHTGTLAQLAHWYSWHTGTLAHWHSRHTGTVGTVGAVGTVGTVGILAQLAQWHTAHFTRAHCPQSPPAMSPSFGSIELHFVSWRVHPCLLHLPRLIGTELDSLPHSFPHSLTRQVLLCWSRCLCGSGCWRRSPASSCLPSPSPRA